MSFSTSVAFVGRLGVVAGLSLVFSCSGKAIVDPGGGGAGTGSTTSTTSTSSSGTSTSSSGTSSSSSTSTSSSGGQPCEGLPEAACIADGGCAPLYDDTCCPSCDPGPCGDCVAFAFHSCVQIETVCVLGEPSCGVVPEWACSVGGAAFCGWDAPCQGTPGCVQAECSPQMGCPCIPEQDCSCRAVTAKSCNVPDCDAPPPPCLPGFVAESDGFCFTGWCIPATVCGG